MMQSWDEYAADQRTATHRELISIRKTLQGILFVLIVIGLVVGIPLMYAVAQ